ncbi:unnamed protein product [Caenorhabditis auriculariae]|uniref:TAFII55 protein conserved region domain-containing protein n=1 Tax=Caenorhabditis auriculariae TaxID=2777116 RepID=A0A8S1GSS1_9PELO|nr:unnamed protein product [Caenorhabditis auriculariae]
MSAGGSRLFAKRLAANRVPEVATDDVQDWENHLILRVPTDCVDRVNRLIKDGYPKEEFGIQFANGDMRNAQIRLGNLILSAKIYDLPCTTEVFKTLDHKNIYKVADLSQIVICSHDVQRPQDQDQKQKKRTKKQWQYPHGLTPPMKSARRRRFRKTKKKKYMDAPEEPSQQASDTALFGDQLSSSDSDEEVSMMNDDKDD